MALILDTKFLIAHYFPRSEEDRERIRSFLSKIAEDTLIIPSIVIVEFMKIAGSVIGLEKRKSNLGYGWEAGLKSRRLIRMLLSLQVRLRFNIEMSRWLM